MPGMILFSRRNQVFGTLQGSRRCRGPPTARPARRSNPNDDQPALNSRRRPPAAAVSLLVELNPSAFEIANQPAENLRVRDNLNKRLGVIAGELSRQELVLDLVEQGVVALNQCHRSPYLVPDFLTAGLHGKTIDALTGRER